MIRVERAIDVERSASEVFERLTRIEDLPRWEPAIVEAALESPPPIGEGSRVRIVVDVASQRTTALGTVTAFERPSRIAVAARAGGADLAGDVTVTPLTDSSCRVALATTIRLGGLLRFVEGVARSRIEAGAPEMAASVKRWLESDVPAGAARDDGQTRSG
ncbi:MAG TPA: SRPBCC family protein [Candidatus Limnocylindrales bacterium]|nr:SRPBCC family protein [Candidatus Limnocylindrales bacterium]